MRTIQTVQTIPPICSQMIYAQKYKGDGFAAYLKGSFLFSQF